MRRPDAIREAGLRELGVHEDLRRITVDEKGAARPYPERVKLFDEYKLELKKRYRKLALELHPDRTAELPEEERAEKAARFRGITSAVDLVMNLAPRPVSAPAPRPRIEVRPHYGGTVIIMNWGPTTTSTSTAGGWGFPGGFRNGI